MPLNLDLRNAIPVLELVPNLGVSGIFIHLTTSAQEKFGSWGPAGLELLKEIGTRTIIASGNKRARANLFQNISMAMIRGNIINVKSTLPPLNKNQEFLFLN